MDEMNGIDKKLKRKTEIKIVGKEFFVGFVAGGVCLGIAAFLLLLVFSL